MGNAPNLLESKVEEGWRVLAAAMPDDNQDSSSMPLESSECPSMPVDNISLTCPTILVLGSEGAGIPPEVMSCVTQGVYISPSKWVDTQVDSLNVSVAAAIVIHKLCSSAGVGS